jgi:hypothetical protein
MAGGRLDSCFKLGELIQAFDSQNMIFLKMFEVKTALKMFFEELDFFQLFFTSYF